MVFVIKRRLGNCLTQFFQHHERRVGIGFRHKCHKFFAAIATEKIHFTQAFGNRAPNHFNHSVARLMTKVIVYLFKIIDIKNRNRQWPLVALPALNFCYGAFVVRLAVRQLGERVMQCFVPMFFQTGAILLRFGFHQFYFFAQRR